ncbi:hypothetical protein G7Z17_g9304 [Cylindrodendrum hubeiense]|uniref:Uncharacterized protein n=1 Tax=Cylindrodendrum hubeiense TaxID=595255 RepID=A0A9P5H0N0_9HYPO|nr:hypothetical protein G7Z17_g9304 [Cylindrodendrum hubeiense]
MHSQPATVTATATLTPTATAAASLLRNYIAGRSQSMYKLAAVDGYRGGSMRRRTLVDADSEVKRGGERRLQRAESRISPKTWRPRIRHPRHRPSASTWSVDMERPTPSAPSAQQPASSALMLLLASSSGAEALHSDVGHGSWDVTGTAGSARGACSQLAMRPIPPVQFGATCPKGLSAGDSAGDSAQDSHSLPAPSPVQTQHSSSPRLFSAGCDAAHDDPRRPTTTHDPRPTAQPKACRRRLSPRPRAVGLLVLALAPSAALLAAAVGPRPRRVPGALCPVPV